MPVETVHFGVGPQHRITTLYDRSGLHLGAAVHVEFNTSREPVAFFALAKPETEPWYVVWIAPSEWYVALAPPIVATGDDAARASAAVGDRLDQATVAAALASMAREVRPEHMYKTSERHDGRLGRLAGVLDRLDLCQQLTSDTADPGALRPWWPHAQALIEYLYLTCFDLLGQGARFTDFASWLASREMADARNAAVANLAAPANPVAAARGLHDEYVRLFGVRNAFMRFLHEVLPSDARRRLLASVQITVVGMPPAMGESLQGDDKAKEKYLFELRNRYTHRAQYVAGIPPALRGGARRDWASVWVVREQVFGETQWRDYMVRNWPVELDQAVRSGLAAFLASATAP